MRNVVIALSLLACINAYAKCTPKDIEIKDHALKFVKHKCDSPICDRLEGAVTLVNRCTIPIGVMIQLIAYDKDDKAIQVKDGWPASTRNLPIGDNPVSLEGWLLFDPRIHSVGFKVIDVRVWKPF